MDGYIEAASPEARPVLAEIRQLVERVVPDATPTISYQIPAFRRERVFIYFAAFKSHIGIYPPLQGDDALEPDLLPYRGEKGNLRFPLSKPVPYALIERVVEALAQQYAPRR